MEYHLLTYSLLFLPIRDRAISDRTAEVSLCGVVGSRLSVFLDGEQVADRFFPDCNGCHLWNWIMAFTCSRTCNGQGQTVNEEKTSGVSGWYCHHAFDVSGI